MTKERIHEYIPPCNHDNVYVETFVGSGVMFFNLPGRPHAFLNDIDENLVNFWRVVQTRRADLEAKLQYVWPTRDNTRWFINYEKDLLDRACLYYVNNIMCQFLTKPGSIQKHLDFWSQKLDQSRVFIDNKPFNDEIDYLLKIYKIDSQNGQRPMRCLFYNDPPYWGMEGVYKSYIRDGFNRRPQKFNHRLLAQKNLECKTKGHFVLTSYNDCPEIRNLYPESDGWYLKSIDYSPNGKGTNRARDRTELLICSEPFHRYLQATTLLNYFPPKEKNIIL